MMKIRDFIARGAALCDKRGFKQVQLRIHVLSHFSNKSTSGQASGSPIRFVARSSANEWDNIISYDRNQPDGAMRAKETLASYRGQTCGVKYAEAVWAMTARPQEIL